MKRFFRFLFAVLFLIGMNSCGNNGGGGGVAATSNCASNTTCLAIVMNAPSAMSLAYGTNPTTIKVGSIVQWTNQDGQNHTVTSTSGPASFSSGSLAPGATFTYTFTVAGTYNYMCTIHPAMTGQLIVQ